MLISENNFHIFYHILYGLSFLIAFLSVIKIDSSGESMVTNLFLNKICIAIAVLFICLIGFREYNVGSDTESYYYYNWVLDTKSTINTEMLFDFIIQTTKNQGFSFTVFLLLVSMVFYINIIRSFFNISKIFKVNIFFLFFIFISLFFSKSLGINIIRQGLSLSFLLLAYSRWINNKSIITYLLPLLLAIITHTTSVIPIAIFIVAYFLKKKGSLNFYLAIYICAIIMSFFNFGILTLAPFLKGLLEGSYRANYLTEDSDLYVTGFKPQFVVFNSVFLVFSLYIYHKILDKNGDLYKKYRIVFLYYIISNIVFFMMFQIPYSDRFGLFSWIVIPVLISPLFTYEKTLIKFKTPFVILFSLIYIFFAVYGN